MKQFIIDKHFYIITFLFVLANSIFIATENFLLLLIPFALIVGISAIRELDKVLLAAVFFTPLSIPLHEYIQGLSFDLSLPAEPLLITVMFIFIFKALKGNFLDTRIMMHPVSIAIYINLFWIFFTSISSSMPVVSFKFLISRIWFVIPLYFFSAHLFRDSKYINRYLWLYIFSLLIVAIYTMTRHFSFGLFDKEAAHFVMSPFYKDHTSYGAVLAMFIPILILFIFKRNQKSLRFLALALLPVFLFAVTLSYTRAAWLSLLIASVLLFVFLLKIKIRYLIFFGTIAGIMFFFFQFEITDKLKKNRQDSSEEIEDHLSSMTNIATDASNLERINRWNSAIKMFKERPVLGFGPGTYMFNYAGYQMSPDRTIISTNFGDKGNAHSEYIGPLSESGILGAFSFILILLTTVYTAVNILYKTKDINIKITVFGCFLGLITYYVHGFLNNFLDTDKISVPFWGFTAVIVALDLVSKQQIVSQKT